LTKVIRCIGRPFAFKNIVGERMRLAVEVVDGEPEEGVPPMAEAEEGAVEEAAGEGEGRNKIEPIVESALDIFEGRVVDIRAAKKEVEG
jgi:hypothetical protein